MSRHKFWDGIDVRDDDLIIIYCIYVYMRILSALIKKSSIIIEFLQHFATTVWCWDAFVFTGLLEFILCVNICLQSQHINMQIIISERYSWLFGKRFKFISTVNMTRYALITIFIIIHNHIYICILPQYIYISHSISIAQCALISSIDVGHSANSRRSRRLEWQFDTHHTIAPYQCICFMSFLCIYIYIYGTCTLNSNSNSKTLTRTTSTIIMRIRGLIPWDTQNIYV